MVVGLSKLVGTRVLAIQLTEGSLDLRVDFEGKAVFTVFCDQVDVAEEHDNYSFRFETGWLIVGPASHLRFQPHKGS